jgi:PhnB protein
MSSIGPEDSEESLQVHAEVRGGVVAHLSLANAVAAVEHYKEALAADEVERRLAQDGKRLLHCHLYINGGSLLLADFFPEYGSPEQRPQGFAIHLQVDDIDLWWNRAVRAGMAITMPLARQFWGDRYGQLRDSFGVTWSIAAPGDDDDEAL